MGFDLVLFLLTMYDLVYFDFVLFWVIFSILA